MSPTQELQAAKESIREVEDLDLITERLGQQDHEARKRATRLRKRRLDQGIRVSVAADLLEVSVPTVKAWIEAGILKAAGDDRPQRVRLGSVLRTRALIRDLRGLGRRAKLMPAVLAALEDEQTLESNELKTSLEQMRQGKLVRLSPP